MSSGWIPQGTAPAAAAASLLLQSHFSGLSQPLGQEKGQEDTVLSASCIGHGKARLDLFWCWARWGL